MTIGTDNHDDANAWSASSASGLAFERRDEYDLQAEEMVNLVMRLSRRERYVVSWTHGLCGKDSKSQEAIAAELGIPKERVEKIGFIAIKKLAAMRVRRRESCEFMTERLLNEMNVPLSKSAINGGGSGEMDESSEDRLSRETAERIRSDKLRRDCSDQFVMKHMPTFDRVSNESEKAAMRVARNDVHLKANAIRSAFSRLTLSEANPEMALDCHDGVERCGECLGPAVLSGGYKKVGESIRRFVIESTCQIPSCGNIERFRAVKDAR